MARPARRQQTIDHIRGDICDAAARAFARAGYDGATMAEIAKEAGFAAPTLYSYFSGKREIYDALVEKVTAELLEYFNEPTPAGLTLGQHLELILQRQLAWMEERYEHLVALSEADSSAKDKSEFVLRYVDAVTAVIAQHPDAPEMEGVSPRDAAFVFWSLNNGFHERHFRFEKECSPPDSRVLVRVFFGACRGLAETD